MRWCCAAQLCRSNVRTVNMCVVVQVSGEVKKKEQNKFKPVTVSGWIMEVMEDDGGTLFNKPFTLYDLTVKSFIKNVNQNVQKLDEINYIRILPGCILADIYYEMTFNEKLADILLNELSNLTVFVKLLKYGFAKKKIIKCFTFLDANNKPIAKEIAKVFTLFIQSTYLSKDNSERIMSDTCNSNLNECNSCANSNDCLHENLDSSMLDDAIDDEHFYHISELGLRIGSFLSAAGWIEQSIAILKLIYKVIEKISINSRSVIFKLDCLERLLRAQCEFLSFADAANTINCGNQITQTNDESIPKNLLIMWHRDLSVLNYCKSQFDVSYGHILDGIRLVNKNTPLEITIDVLRQAARVCTIKRSFKKAYFLIKNACEMAKNKYGVDHEKYADTLLDYGNFLLNVDITVESVNFYKESLEIKQAIFGPRNFHLAIQHEDLAYALYVREYNSGHFESAREHVGRAIDILKKLVPSDSLMLASAKRVKALILEEIALDNIVTPNSGVQELLLQSEKLHRSALELSLEAFGEKNVHTAKHYGNLGRLYQTMTKYKESEEMHKRAIEIKTGILGAFDFEVGLSVGHLASLYNYHMEKYLEAEKLYHQSISISLKLFGASYSGLEYDYRGLCHVYECLDDADKYVQYARSLARWRLLREENADGTRLQYSYEINQNATVEEVTKHFFEMSKDVAV